ncbi:MAG TPA: hypothetical protein VHB21_26525 [Minicystis sp.]|nr:hypothetical protein [Minicystis sp.]
MHASKSPGRISWRRCVAAAALAALAAGCGSSRVVGMTDASFAPKASVPMACIQKRDGRTTTLAEGDAGGRPAVSVSGVVLGFSATLNDRVDVDGMQVFAGQKCSWGGVMGPRPICETAIVTENGAQRVLLFQQKFFASPAVLPASTQALVDDWKGRNVLATLRLVDLDPPTQAAFLEVATNRGHQATARSAVMIAGAVAAGAGQVEHKAELKKDGKELMAIGAAMPIDDDDRPIVERYPKLLPIFQSLSQATVVCVGTAR